MHSSLGFMVNNHQNLHLKFGTQKIKTYWKN